MKALPSSVRGNAGLVCVVTFIALASCDGIQSRVEMLRAEHLEIIDDKGTTKMDVEKQIRALEERIVKLEAAQAAPPPAPTAVPSASGSAAPSATPDASVAPPDAAAVDPLAPRRSPGRQFPTAPKAPPRTDVF